eukprot:COSAG02_NODE_6401_length_3598_cov_19.791994_3_plen_135_part_00
MTVSYEETVAKRGELGGIKRHCSIIRYGSSLYEFRYKSSLRRPVLYRITADGVSLVVEAMKAWLVLSGNKITDRSKDLSGLTFANAANAVCKRKGVPFVWGRGRSVQPSTRIRMFGAVLKSRNYTNRQYELNSN